MNNVLMISSTKCIAKYSNWRHKILRNVRLNNIKYREKCGIKTFQYVISQHSNIKSIRCETRKFDIFLNATNFLNIIWNNYFNIHVIMIKFVFSKIDYLMKIVCENDFSSHEHLHFERKQCWKTCNSISNFKHDVAKNIRMRI